MSQSLSVNHFRLKLISEKSQFEVADDFLLHQIISSYLNQEDPNFRMFFPHWQDELSTFTDTLFIPLNLV